MIMTDGVSSVSDIKKKCLWFIGRDRVVNSKKFNAFLYSECGDIVLGILDLHSEFNILIDPTKEQIIGVRYTLGFGNITSEEIKQGYRDE